MNGVDTYMEEILEEMRGLGDVNVPRALSIHVHEDGPEGVKVRGDSLWGLVQHLEDLAFDPEGMEFKHAWKLCE